MVYIAPAKILKKDGRELEDDWQIVKFKVNIFLDGNFIELTRRILSCKLRTMVKRAIL